MIFQFLVSVVAGIIALWWDNHQLAKMHDHYSGSTLGAFFVGVAASYAVMFVINWVRFGWKAARSLRMSG